MLACRAPPWHPTHEAAMKFWTAADVEERLGGVDIVHANNYWCPRQLRAARLIYTLYDLSFLQEPSWTTEANRVGCFHGVFGAAAAADWIVAISQASRDHYLKTFPSFPHDRVKVIFPGSRFAASGSPARRSTALKGITPGKYWLSVGAKPSEKVEILFKKYLAKAEQQAATAPPAPAAGAAAPTA